MAVLGTNCLVNPDGSQGLTGWQNSGGSAVAGGFSLGSTAFMYQDLDLTVLQEPYNFEITGYFQPSVDWVNEIHIGAYIIFSYFHADGTKDIYTYPMKVEKIVAGKYKILKFINGKTDSTITGVRFGIKTHDRAGIFTGLSCRKEVNAVEQTQELFNSIKGGVVLSHPTGVLPVIIVHNIFDTVIEQHTFTLVS